MSIGATDEGRAIRLMSPGEMETEKSATEIDPRTGAWTNFPTIHGGRQRSPSEAFEIIRRAGMRDPESTQGLQSFGSREAAEAAARARSPGIGEKIFTNFPWAFYR